MIHKEIIAQINNCRLSLEKAGVESIDRAIDYHYKLLRVEYGKNRLFYKTIFKSYRFLLGAFIMVDYYNLEESTISGIVKRMIPFKFMSKNSISSFFSFLIFSSRIKIIQSKNDARKMSFHITKKLELETYKMVQSMFLPLEGVFNIKQQKKQEDISEYLKSYFKNFAPLVYNGLFNFDKIDNANFFITKDAGHSIILNLFCNKVKVGDGIYETLSVKKLIENCGVSRSHIKKIIRLSYDLGYVLNPSSETSVIVTESFINFTRKYMIEYFSFCMIGGKVDLELLQGGSNFNT